MKKLLLIVLLSGCYPLETSVYAPDEDACYMHEHWCTKTACYWGETRYGVEMRGGTHDRIKECARYYRLCQELKEESHECNR